MVACFCFASADYALKAFSPLGHHDLEASKRFTSFDYALLLGATYARTPSMVSLGSRRTALSPNQADGDQKRAAPALAPIQNSH